MAQRPTQEELNRDEVAESLTQFVAFVRRNATRLFALVVLILVAALVASAMRSHRARVARSTNELMMQTLGAYTRMTAATDPAQRTQLGDRVLAAADSLIESHPSAAVTPRARCLRAATLSQRGEYEQADDAYAACLTDAGDAAERATALIGRGGNAENAAFAQADDTARNDQLIAAVGYYEKALDAAPDGSYLRTVARMGQARVEELLGHSDTAADLYRTILEERPAPPVADDPNAEGRDQDVMALLNVQINATERRLSLASVAEQHLAALEGGEPGTSSLMPPPPATHDAATTQPSFLQSLEELSLESGIESEEPSAR